MGSDNGDKEALWAPVPICPPKVGIIMGTRRVPIWVPYGHPLQVAIYFLVPHTRRVCSNGHPTGCPYGAPNGCTINGDPLGPHMGAHRAPIAGRDYFYSRAAHPSGVLNGDPLGPHMGTLRVPIAGRVCAREKMSPFG